MGPSRTKKKLPFPPLIHNFFDLRNFTNSNRISCNNKQDDKQRSVSPSGHGLRQGESRASSQEDRIIKPSSPMARRQPRQILGRHHRRRRRRDKPKYRARALERRRSSTIPRLRDLPEEVP